MHSDVTLNLLAGTMVGATYSITLGRVPRNFGDQTDSAILRAIGLRPTGVAEL